MKQMILGAFIFLLLSAVSTHAAYYGDEGGYIVVGGIISYEEFDNAGGNSDNGLIRINDIDESTGFELTFGNRFRKNWSYELEWDFLSGFDINTTIGPFEVDSSSFTFNIKWSPLIDRVQPFLFGGMGMMYADLKTTGGPVVCGWWWCFSTNTVVASEYEFTTRWGGGTDVYITEYVAISLDLSYMVPTGDLQDLKYLSFNWGVLFKY